MMTNKKNVTNLPRPGSAARRVLDKWIDNGGKIRVFEASDAYNGPSAKLFSIQAMSGRRYYSASLSGLLKRYGSKPAGEAGKHTPWILDEKWCARPVEGGAPQPSPRIKSIPIVIDGAIHGADDVFNDVLPPMSKLTTLNTAALPTPTPTEKTPALREYTFEVKTTIVVNAADFAEAKAVAFDKLDAMYLARRLKLEPTKIQ